MATPKVSILLPNLNYRRFLEARMHSILAQTFSDWELIILDGYSDDGAWELFQNYARHDARIRASQARREGIYAGLNRCIELAQGQYIYIATSDDTMSSHCLERMVKALETHAECDLCQCRLDLIDESGTPMKDRSRIGPVEHFFGDTLKHPHIRQAPYDGIVHCAVGNVYTSLTQLLIRHSVFDKIGLFPTTRGGQGDFEWGLRAGLVCNVLYLPESLATWRIHPEQASAIPDYESAAQQSRYCTMIMAALPILRQYLPEYARQIRLWRLLFPYRRKQIEFGRHACHSRLEKALFLSRFMFINPSAWYDYIARRFLKKSPFSDDFTYIRTVLKQIGCDTSITML